MRRRDHTEASADDGVVAESSPQEKRRPYKTPKLTPIGTVRELTQKQGSAFDDHVITGHTRHGRR